MKSLTARPRAVLAAVVGMCLLASLVLTAGADRATSAPLTVVILGKTASTPQPSCPGTYMDVQTANGVESQEVDACRVEGHVTGFQVSTGGVNLPLRAPFDGKIVSWSISLGRPSARSTQSNPNADGLYHTNELGSFNALLGQPAQARIGILRPMLNAKVKTFKMVRQSPIETLNPYFGTTPQFVLDHPLTILRDQIVGLTIPTWAPMFYNLGTTGDIWRGSRVSPDCAAREDIVNGHPQQKVGSTKVYTCTYEGARLLYTATLIKKPGG